MNDTNGVKVPTPLDLQIYDRDGLDISATVLLDCHVEKDQPTAGPW